MKPPAGTQIDWTNPLTKGLINCLPFLGEVGDPINYVPGGLKFTRVGTATYGRDNDGSFLDVSGAATDRIDSTTSYIASDKTPSGTIVCAVKPTTFGATGRVWGNHTNFEVRYITPDTVDFDAFSNVDLGKAGAVFVDKLFTVGTAWSLGATQTHNELFVDGLSENEGTVNNVLPTTGVLAIGSSTSLLSQGMLGNIYFWYEWDRELSANEHRQINENPYQIFKPKRIVGISRVTEEVKFSVIKKVRTKQPPAGIGIDWSNPLTKSLRLLDACRDALPVDETGFHQSLPDSDPFDFTTSSIGFGRSNVLLGSETREFDASDLSGLDAVTVLSIHRIDDPTQDFGAWYLGDTGEGVGFKSSYSLQQDDTSSVDANEYFFYVYDSGDVQSKTPATGATNASKEVNTVIGRYGSGVVFDVWLNGSKYSEDVTPPSITTKTMTTDTMFQPFGGAKGAASIPLIIGHLSAVWDRALTDAEIVSVSKNPWQIFEPELIHVPFNEELPKLATFEKERTRQPR